MPLSYAAQLPPRAPETMSGPDPAHPAAILQDGRRQHSSRHLRHVIFHFDSKFLDVGIQVVAGILHLQDKRRPSQETSSLAILILFWVSRRAPRREAEADKNSPKKVVGELEDDWRGRGNGSCYKGGKKRKQQLKAQEARIALQSPRQ